MNLTNEEKAKIFAMYLGCEVAFQEKKHYEQLAEEHTPELSGYIHENFSDDKKVVRLTVFELGMFSLDCMTLLLKSLEDITDEDINSLIAIDWKFPDGVNKFVNGFELVYFDDNDSANCQYIHFNNLTAEQHQFLISRGYAVPLYPYNKTAIELGLAIDTATLTQNQKP